MWISQNMFMRSIAHCESSALSSQRVGWRTAEPNQKKLLVLLWDYLCKSEKTRQLAICFDAKPGPSEHH
jgi:hypothetical protein